MGTTAR
jgi:hypothetical protein